MTRTSVMKELKGNSVLGKNAHAQIENTTHFKGQYKVSD